MRRHGFTLVELLVVVSIIALLIAMLLPALNKARATAQSVVCLSSLRQMVVGEMMYAQDHQGRLTPCDYRDYAWNKPSPSWAGVLAGMNYLNAPIFTVTSYTAYVDSGQPLTRNSVFRCPSGLTDAFTTGSPTSRTDPDGARPYPSGIIYGDGAKRPSNKVTDVWYGVNACTGSYDYPIWRVASDNDTDNYSFYPDYKRIGNPARTVAFFDGCTGANWFNAGGNRINARHIDGTVTNLAFWDGHSESAASDAMPVSQSISHLNSLQPSYIWRLSQ